MTSYNDENLFLLSSASPHGGFIAVASDDGRPAAVHRGNPREGAGSVGNWSSTEFALVSVK